VQEYARLKKNGGPDHPEVRRIGADGGIKRCAGERVEGVYIQLACRSDSALSRSEVDVASRASFRARAIVKMMIAAVMDPVNTKSVATSVQ